MLKNYLVVALRNLFRHKIYSAINLLGLAVGMTCSVLIFLWVLDELSYDRFHKNAGRIFRVVENQYSGGGQVFQTASTPAPLAAQLKSEFPEIEQVCRINFVYGKTLFGLGKQLYYEEEGLYVDNSFFEVFSFQLVRGDPKKALIQPNSIVITEELARKYFAYDNPLGKTIKLKDNKLVQITGVIKKNPPQSVIRFNFLLPTEFQENYESNLDNWGNNWLRTYLLLSKNAQIDEVNAKIKNVIKKNNPDAIVEIYLQALKDVYLRTTFNNTPGRIQYVYILSIIATLILLIACINFMNLSTARSIRRAKEVGLRKVIGARQGQLVRQFLGESLLLSMIALVFALLLIDVLLPFFNQLTEKKIHFSLLDKQEISLILVVVAFTGIFSGTYPAFFLSAYKPVKVLKGNYQNSRGGVRLRKALVIFQFSLSIILMISTAIVYKQLNFIKNKDLGYQPENLVWMPLRGNFASSYAMAKGELMKIPGVEVVSAASQLITGFGNSTWDVSWQGKPSKVRTLTVVTMTDFDYIETLKLKMKSGRTFSRNFSTDTSTFIVNEAFVRATRLKKPVGEQLKFWDLEGKIVGVVKDFHYQSVHQPIEPVILACKPTENWLNTVILRINQQNTATVLAEAEKVWKKFNPSYPFEYHFIADDFESMYKAEKRLSAIFLYFALLAIFISCLGLFGLVTFATEQKTKEIGIRKVMGASVSSLIRLVSIDFLRLVLFSNLIAIPVSYWMMYNWLQDFAYRIHLAGNWFIFVLASLLALLIAILTVGLKAYNAALVNPVEILRDE